MLTYHVAPRFDIAAKGGPLKLGTVVADLATVVPLNGGVFHLQVPDDLPYEPVIQTDFKDTLMAARSLNANAWLKFLGLPVGASASIENSRDLESGVECDSVTTTYFDDPAETYISKCLSAAPVRSWLRRCKDYTADLHVVTGLKVANGLRYNRTTAHKTAGEAELSGEEPHTQTEAGVKTGLSKEEKKKQGFAIVGQDIVIAFRVDKYRCTRKLLGLSKDRDMTSEGVVQGDLQGKPPPNAEVAREEVEIQLLETKYETTTKTTGPSGSTEYWVGLC